MGRLSRAAIAPVLVAGAVVALVWAPAGDSSRARAALKISPILATFSEPARTTTYAVSPDADATAPITYAWTLDVTSDAAKVDPAKGLDTACNQHDAANEQKFVWHHGNKGDPEHDDGCDHDLQGKWGHQGLVTVVVTDGAGSRCTATYKGSFSTEQNAALSQEPAGDPVCSTVGQPPPPPPPPPLPPKCKCLLLTARVVPSSLKLVVGHDEDNGRKYDNEERAFTFTVHWVMNCSKGNGGCNGRLPVQQPARGKFLLHWNHKKTPARDPRSFQSSAPGAAAEWRTAGSRSNSTGHRPGAEW